jgi:hypothetical protein
MDAKAPLKVSWAKRLSYCIVHHQDGFQLQCPDVSSSLALCGNLGPTNLQEVYFLPSTVRSLI